LRYSAAAAVARGVGHGGWGPDPLKICRKGQILTPSDILSLKTTVG